MDINSDYLDARLCVPWPWVNQGSFSPADADETRHDATQTEHEPDAADCANGAVAAAALSDARKHAPMERPSVTRYTSDRSRPDERYQAPKPKLRHVDRRTDQAGRQRLYYRRRHGPRLPLHGDEGTPEFQVSYAVAHRIDGLLRRLPDRQKRPRRTLESVAQRYLDSRPFAALAPTTRAAYRRTIHRLIAVRPQSGVPVHQLTRAAIERLLPRIAYGPAAQADALKKLRVLFRFAIGLGWITDDPSKGIAPRDSRRRAAWSAEEIAAFDARWPVETRERLAFDLLRRSGLRGARLVSLTIADIARWTVVPAHSWERRRQRSAADSASYALTTARGKPFSAAGFGKFMARAIDTAGLPARCIADTLRPSRSRKSGST